MISDHPAMHSTSMNQRSFPLRGEPIQQISFKLNANRRETVILPPSPDGLDFAILPFLPRQPDTHHQHASQLPPGRLRPSPSSPPSSMINSFRIQPFRSYTRTCPTTSQNSTRDIRLYAPRVDLLWKKPCGRAIRGHKARLGVLRCVEVPWDLSEGEIRARGSGGWMW